MVLAAATQAFPAFTYDARTGNLVDKTFIACQAFWGMLVGVAWGAAVAVFVEPLGLGVVRNSWLCAKYTSMVTYGRDMPHDDGRFALFSVLLP